MGIRISYHLPGSFKTGKKRDGKQRGSFFFWGGGWEGGGVWCGGARGLGSVMIVLFIKGCSSFLEALSARVWGT